MNSVFKFLPIALVAAQKYDWDACNDIPLDIEWIQDITKSADNYWPNVRQEFPEMFRELRRFRDVRYAFSEFAEKPSNYPWSETPTSYEQCYNNAERYTQDISHFMTTANQAEGIPFWGGDEPDNQLDALYYSTTLGRGRKEALNIVILSTDSTYHTAEDGAEYGLPPFPDWTAMGTWSCRYNAPPSFEQLNQIFTFTGVLPIFLVPENVAESYHLLNEGLGGVGTVEVMNDDGSGAAEMIIRAIQKLVCYDNGTPPPASTTIPEETTTVPTKDGSLTKTAEITKDGSLTKTAEITKDGSLTKTAEITKDGSLTKTAEITKDGSLTKTAEITKDGSLTKTAGPEMEVPTLPPIPDNLPINPFGYDRVDIVWLQDLSESFSDDLPNVVLNAPLIAQRVSTILPSRFAASSFTDKPVEPLGFEGDFCFMLNQDFTDQAEVFSAAVGEWSAAGGADFEEAISDAIVQAASMDWDMDAFTLRVLVVVTDAPPHFPEDGLAQGLAHNDFDGAYDCATTTYFSTEQVRQVVHGKDIHVAFLVTSGMVASYEHYLGMLGVQGSVHEIAEDSRNLGDAMFAGVLDALRG